MMTQKSIAKSLPTLKLRCDYCKKEFVREISFANHVCKLKRRFLEKDRKYATLAFATYQKFYEIEYRGRKTVTYDQFMRSTLYEAFIRFGKHMVDIGAVNPPEFIDFVVRSKTPIDKWCKDDLYRSYIGQLALKETPYRAVERNILLMQSWANDTGHELQDFFVKISPVLATQWLLSGRMSPWVMINCGTGQELISRFSAEQMDMLKDVLNIRFWNGKFSRHKEEVAQIIATLKEAGL